MPRAEKARGASASRSRRSASRFRREDDAKLYKKLTSRGIGYIDSEVPLFDPPDGESSVRLIPPLADDETPGVDGLGLEILNHYIPGHGYMLCPTMGLFEDRHCPLCDAATRIRGEDEELSMQMRAKRRRLMWVIDLSDEAVKLWAAPVSLIEDFVRSAKNRRTGELYSLQDPEEGHPVFFERIGKGQQTTYTGIQVDGEPLPLPDDVADDIRVFSDILIPPDVDVLAAAAEAFTAAPSRPDRDYVDDDGEEIEERPARRSRRQSRRTGVDEDTDDVPPRRTRSAADPDDEDLDEGGEPDDEADAMRERLARLRRRARGDD